LQERLRFRLEHAIKRLNGVMDSIRARWPNANAVELFVAYELCDNSLDDLIESLDSPGFRDKVQSEVVRRLDPDLSLPEALPPTHDEEEDEPEDAEDDDFVFTMLPDIPVPRPRLPRRKGVPPPTCDLPCPREVRPEVWAQWSAIRKISYHQAQERPNAYYYRHLPPGEVQRSGPWTISERRLFIARMNEMRRGSTTFDECWGTFSLAIPGRVGYQCSNFYRVLLATGEMQDSRYVRGEDGKLHHVSRARPSSDKKAGTAKPRVKRTRKGRKLVELEPLTADSIETIRFVRGITVTVEVDTEAEDDRQMSRYDVWALQNPLPEAVDLITGEVIRVPALSPDGYVLDYRTWIDALAERSVNPFTFNHVTKRQLVVLTTENFAEYADRIVNLRDR
jgi:hypothetical protein